MMSILSFGNSLGSYSYSDVYSSSMCGGSYTSTAACTRYATFSKFFGDFQQSSRDPQALYESTLFNPVDPNETSYERLKRHEKERKDEDEHKDKLEKALKKAQEIIAKLDQKQLTLHFDKSDILEGAQVVEVFDTKAKKVIRQIPTEEALRIAKQIKDYEDKLKKAEQMRNQAINKTGIFSEYSQTNEMRGALLDAIA